MSSQQSRSAYIGPPPPAATLTVEEAALVLGVSRAVAYAGVRKGELPAIRLGGRVLIPRAGLEDLLLRGNVARITHQAPPKLLAIAPARRRRKRAS